MTNMRVCDHICLLLTLGGNGTRMRGAERHEVLVVPKLLMLTLSLGHNQQILIVLFNTGQHFSVRNGGQAKLEPRD